MKLRKKLCVLVLAALLFQMLSGCRTAADDPAETTSAGLETSSKPVHSAKVEEPEIPGQSEEPEETPEPDLWDPNHTLDFAFTPAEGLELPVSGATGYASVKLPLWEELPEEDEGKLATIYNPPEPEEDEDGEEPTEPGGEPTAEPVSEPAPESTPEPAAGPAPESTPEEPAAESAKPAPEAVPEPVPEPTPEVDTTPDWLVTGMAGLPVPLADGPEDTAPADGSGEAEPADEPSEEAEPADGPPAEPGVESLADEPEESGEPEEYDPMEEALLVLEPGTAFTILQESGDWWQVRTQGETGWVEHRYCLINLPDVVPSIVYNDTNAYASAFVSSGRTIPNVTGKQLYHGKEYNPRLGYKEFMMPVLYTMAKDVCQAQQNALAEGNTIVLYEGYRPYSAQMLVVRNLTALSRTDSGVRAGITTQPWNISWFIATGVANHQMGYAMDVSLAKVTQAHVGGYYGYRVVQVDEYEEYTMPTAIHELSMAAATFTQPVGQHSDTAWRYAALSPTMAANEPALALQRYCTEAKLTPLSSEWWHFNDLAAYVQIVDYPSTGNYEIRDCLSTAPQ